MALGVVVALPPDGPRVEVGPGVVGVEAGGAYAWIVRTPHGAGRPWARCPGRGGEDLEFDGAPFKVIATPGHSPGSVMYLYKDVLFTGDSLLRKRDGVAIAPSLMSEDSERSRASLRALEPASFEKIADGHAGVTFGAKGKLARFLAGS